MKKQISLLLAACVLAALCTACSNKTKTVDLPKAKEQIAALTITEDGQTYPLFNSIQEVDAATLKDVYNVDPALFSDYTIAMPLMNVKANLYIIAKPADGKQEEAKKALDDFMSNYESLWENYLPDQYEMVKGRMEAKIGDYYVYIVSQDNGAVYNAIEQSTK